VQLPDSRLVNLSGKPDAGNLHVRFDEGDQALRLVPTLLLPGSLCVNDAVSCSGLSIEHHGVFESEYQGPE
jgi:hypothetical protein